MVGVVTRVMSPQAKDSCSHQTMSKVKKESPLTLQDLIRERGPRPVWKAIFPVGLAPSVWLRRPLGYVDKMGVIISP